MQQNNTKGISKPSIRVSLVAISLGLAVMLITTAVVSGFKQEIRKKITSLNGAIILSSLHSAEGYESLPISTEQGFLPDLKEINGIVSISEFALKAGILRKNEEVEGIVLKGVQADYDFSSLHELLVEGGIPDFMEQSEKNEVLVSDKTARLLQLKTGDSFQCYFVQNPPRIRKFTVAGIYRNSLESFNNLVFCNISHIKKLNDWDENQTGGFEIQIRDFKNLEEINARVNQMVGIDYTNDEFSVQVESVKEKYPQFFNWLSLFDTNTMVILTLMILVAGINMISGILILILERTRFIGILKALGASNWNIRKIFIYHASYFILKGMIIGNILGLGLLYIQHKTHFIALDESSYYLDHVPVSFDLLNILLLNVGTLIITSAMLFFPSMIITRISPAKVIRFD